MSVGQWGCCVNKTGATVPTFLSGDNNRLQTKDIYNQRLKISPHRNKQAMVE